MIAFGGPVGKFFKSMINYAESGFKNVSDEDYEKRLDICEVCPSNSNGICTECKCILALKAKIFSQNCPKGLWPNDISPSVAPSGEVSKQCGGCQGIKK